MDGVNRYDCKCNNGYYGTNCEKKIIDEKGEDAYQVLNGIAVKKKKKKTLENVLLAAKNRLVHSVIRSLRRMFLKS